MENDLEEGLLTDEQLQRELHPVVKEWWDMAGYSVADFEAEDYLREGEHEQAATAAAGESDQAKTIERVARRIITKPINGITKNAGLFLVREVD
jgi:hypothetical protein